MNDHTRNRIRYNRLPEHLKEVLNCMALNEFLKPIKERRKPIELLDIVEYPQPLKK